MTIVRRIARNTIALVIAELITKILAFIITIFIARHLLEADFGKYSFAFAFTSFFAIFSDLGLHVLTIREVARCGDRAHLYLGNVSLMKAALSCVAFILLAIIVSLTGFPPDITYAVYIVGAYVILNSFNQLFFSFFRAFEKMEYESIVRILEKIIIFAGVLMLVVGGYGLIPIVGMYLLANIVAFVVAGTILLKKIAVPRFSMDYAFMKDALREALPFGITAIFVTIYFQIDTVMLSFMQGDAVVGWYNAAYQLIFGLMFIPGAFVGAIFPVMSRFHTSSPSSLWRLFRGAFKYLFISSLPIVIIGFLYAPEIISLLFGSAYEQSAVALQVLILVIPVIFLTSLLGPTLQAINWQRTVTSLTGVSALFNVGLNMIMIPLYSYVGASMATVLTEILGLIFLLYFLGRNTSITSLVHPLFQTLVAGLGFFLFLYVIDMVLSVHWILLSVVGILIYGSFLWAMNALSGEDVVLFRELLGR